MPQLFQRHPENPIIRRTRFRRFPEALGDTASEYPVRAGRRLGIRRPSGTVGAGFRSLHHGRG